MFAVFFVVAFRLGLSVPPAPALTPGELVKQLAKGEVPFASIIEPRRGLIWIDHFQGGGDETPRKVAKHLCGPELGGERAELQKRLVDDAKRTLEAHDGEILCEPGFGGTTCTIGAAGEWDPAVHLVFQKFPSTRAWPEHLALVAVYIDDDVLVPDETIRVQHEGLVKASKELKKNDCR